jgi:integrase
MSIRKVVRKSGKTSWEVRYWDTSGVKRSKAFDRAGDARDFEAMVRQLKQREELPSLDRGKTTLGEFAKRWWVEFVVVELAASTQETYSTMWRCQISPRWGKTRLRDITPGEVTKWSRSLKQSGVGAETIKKSLTVMQSCLRYAVEEGEIELNPLKQVTKPSSRRNAQKRTLTPRGIESIRTQLSTGPNGERDRTLVSVMAYAGLRPSEALALKWEDLRENTLCVERALSNGEFKDTKTGTVRYVKLLGTLKSDLNEWRLISGRRSGLIFPSAEGDAWKHEAYKSWARNAFGKASAAATGTKETPYVLRHSFASLAIHGGASLPQVADWMGNSPAITLDHYLGIFSEELERIDADELIREARNARPDGSQIDDSSETA